MIITIADDGLPPETSNFLALPPVAALRCARQIAKVGKANFNFIVCYFVEYLVGSDKIMGRVVECLLGLVCLVWSRLRSSERLSASASQDSFQ